MKKSRGHDNGTMENNGTVENQGTMDNNGTLKNRGTMENNETFENNGTMENNRAMGKSGGTENLVTATFDDTSDADRATDTVIDQIGYDRDDVTVLMSKELRDKYYSDETEEVESGNMAVEGAGIGGATGGTIGGIAGALLAAGGAVLLPGIGLAISGPIAAVLAGAGTGGAAGSIIGALVGAGIPEERAKRYKEDIENGRVVLGVHPKSETDARRIVEEWQNLGAHRIDTGKYDFDLATV